MVSYFVQLLKFRSTDHLIWIRFVAVALATLERAIFDALFLFATHSGEWNELARATYGSRRISRAGSARRKSAASSRKRSRIFLSSVFFRGFYATAFVVFLLIVVEFTRRKRNAITLLRANESD